MLFVISPAKKMVDADDSFAWRDMPRFLPQTRELLAALRALSFEEARALWKCSDALAELNYERVARMDLDAVAPRSPAVFSYEGIQYQNMAPRVLASDQLEYLQNHLRILSGFYGVLRPFDAVVPYRLEMQAKLEVGGARNLYAFWGSRLFDALLDDLPDDSAASPASPSGARAPRERAIVNLASVEYAKAIEPYARPAARQGDFRYVTCLFGTVKDGKLVQRSTEAKAARGTFVRWCAENAIEHVSDLGKFNIAGYALNEELSGGEVLVFAR